MTEASKVGIDKNYKGGDKIRIAKFLLMKTRNGYWLEHDGGEAMSINSIVFEKMIERFFNEHF